MWGWNPDTAARIQEGVRTPEEVAEQLAKRKAEIMIEESGEGVCVYCHLDIMKNTTLGVWESETLVGYCTDAKDSKHKPKIVWKTDD